MNAFDHMVAFARRPARSEMPKSFPVERIHKYEPRGATKAALQALFAAGRPMTSAEITAITGKPVKQIGSLLKVPAGHGLVESPAPGTWRWVR